MKSRSAIHGFASIGLLVAAAVVGCGASAPGDNPNGVATGSNAGSGGAAVMGSGGTGGSKESMGAGGVGTGGAAGTGGVPTDTADAREDAVASEGGAGVSPDAGVPRDANAGDAASAGDAGGGMPQSDASAGPCTGVALRPGQSTVTIQHAGGNRNYILHVPPSYTGKTRVPLVIEMHGSGGNATGQSMVTFWTRKADTEGFVLIYPNALNARWNAGTCCSPSVEQNVDDVGFLRAVVEKTTTDGCIDRKRAYAGGLSGGGLMAYRLACMAADMFAAIAPVSGATVTAPCKPSAPVSVVAFRGLSDDLVPYNGGMPLQWYFQGAKADFDQWSQLDQCTGPTTASHGICQTKTQCAGGADVTLCSVNGGHVHYDAAASAGAAIPDVAWEIYQRHALP